MPDLLIIHNNIIVLPSTGECVLYARDHSTHNTTRSSFNSNTASDAVVPTLQTRASESRKVTQPVRNGAEDST